MNVQQLLLILRARYRTILLALLGTVAMTIIVTLQLPKQYTAVTSIFLDIKPDPIAGIMLPAMVIPSYLATQLDIINSDRVAQNVVKVLKLDTNPAAREQWFEATQGNGDITVWLATLLKSQLEIKPSRESSVITLEYKAADPRFAATVANAFAQSYIQTNVELKVEPAQQYTEWFALQGKTLRDNLEKAQERLSSFQREHRIVASDERVDYESAKLNEISTQLTIAQAQTADAQSKLRAGSDTLPEYVQNSVVSSLRGEVARAEARREQLAVTLGKNHPQYQRMESELNALKEKLESETRHITSGFATSAGVGKEREAALRSALEAQKQKLLNLRRERDELAVLTRDVEAAQKAYEAVTQRTNQTRLESRSTQTNVSVLTSASEPLSPSSPKMRLNVLLAIAVGTLLGLGVAFLLELIDRRIRSTLDLTDNLQLPVLGVINKVKVSRRPVFGRAAVPALPSP